MSFHLLENKLIIYCILLNLYYIYFAVNARFMSTVRGDTIKDDEIEYVFYK